MILLIYYLTYYAIVILKTFFNYHGLYQDLIVVELMNHELMAFTTILTNLNFKTLLFIKATSCVIRWQSYYLCYSFLLIPDYFSCLLWQSIGSLQKKYSIGSFELLSKTAPIQACSLIILGPFVDYYLSGKLITNYTMSSGAIVSHHRSVLNLDFFDLYLSLIMQCWVAYLVYL